MRALTALAIGVMALVTVPAVASAGVESADRPVLTPVAADPTTGVVSQAGLTVCKFTAYNQVGYTYCEMGFDRLDWGGGNVEWFVVGTNFAIWHIWRGGGSWKSLGGEAIAWEENYADTFTSPRVGVATIGTDGNRWCRYRGSGNWAGGWNRC